MCMYQRQPTWLIQFYSFEICIKVFLYNDTLPSLYHEVNIESKLYSSHATIRLEASWCHFNAISRHSRHNRPPHHYHLHQQQLIKAFKQTLCNALEHKYQTRQQIFAEHILFWLNSSPNHIALCGMKMQIGGYFRSKSSLIKI